MDIFSFSDPGFQPGPARPSGAGPAAPVGSRQDESWPSPRPSGSGQGSRFQIGVNVATIARIRNQQGVSWRLGAVPRSTSCLELPNTRRIVPDRSTWPTSSGGGLANALLAWICGWRPHTSRWQAPGKIRARSCRL